MVTFTLYSRSWCHLCEDMLAALRKLEAPGRPFEVAVVDVDADPALVERFDELVPVLFGDLAEPELCHYFLDETAVRRYVERYQPIAMGGVRSASIQAVAYNFTQPGPYLWTPPDLQEED
ncbi:glutaredoxin family protein [Massilia sp.]|uniref:glutaredoxin family protein n=1 Tax=Massilia sp. TaxID=1882437 RepID=UPI0028996E49|nr:glutaredoxin family protein [Massilia sp.]